MACGEAPSLLPAIFVSMCSTSSGNHVWISSKGCFQHHIVDAVDLCSIIGLRRWKAARRAIGRQCAATNNPNAVLQAPIVSPKLVSPCRSLPQVLLHVSCFGIAALHSRYVSQTC